MLNFKNFCETFDRDEFLRHMDALKKREQLKKTNPVLALAKDLADKEKDHKSKNKSDTDYGDKPYHQDPYNPYNPNKVL